MSKKSAGLLLYREKTGKIEVLLVHPGGPFWEKKDEGSWSIPKGEFNEDEDPLDAARREFEEETGASPQGDALPLAPVRQPSGKLVFAFAMRGDFDPSRLESNSFSMEWPPRSGRMASFPEVDRAEWFPWESAVTKIQNGQRPILEQLREVLDVGEGLSDEG